MAKSIALQNSFREILLEELENIKSSNRHYSMRSFAHKLGVSASVLSEFFNEKRNLSAKMIGKIISNINLPSEKEELIKVLLMREKYIDSKEVLKEKTNSLISQDQNFIIEDSLYFSFLSLMETKGFKESHQWIAKRLETNVERVNEIIKDLLNLRLIGYDRRGNLHLTQNGLESTQDIPNSSLRRRHIANLIDAQKNLESTPILKRDYSFVTLPINSEKIPVAKKMIQEFQENLIKVLTTGEKDEVYEFCCQLYPRSNSENTRSIINE